MEKQPTVIMNTAVKIATSIFLAMATDRSYIATASTDKALYWRQCHLPHFENCQWNYLLFVGSEFHAVLVFN